MPGLALGAIIRNSAGRSPLSRRCSTCRWSSWAFRTPPTTPSPSSPCWWPPTSPSPKFLPQRCLIRGWHRGKDQDRW